MLNAVLRTIYVYLLLLVLTRLMGRKLVSQMTLFDFIVGITIGAVAANLAVGSGGGATSAVAVLIMLTVLTIVFGWVTIRGMRARKAIDSEPVVLIINGNIVDENLRKIRLTMDNLMMLLREKSAFNIGDVEFALMETDGNISVQKKSQKEPLTPADLKIPTAYKGLTKDIIIDGQVLEENLRGVNLDIAWLKSELSKRKIDIEKVFYAGLDTEGKLHVSKMRIAEN